MNWIEATHKSYGDDPTEYNGPDPDNCEFCDMEPKYDDLAVCEGCYDYLVEGEEYSYCCTAIITNEGLCISCLEHAESCTEEELEGTNIDINTYKLYTNKTTQKPIEDMSMLD